MKTADSSLNEWLALEPIWVDAEEASGLDTPAELVLYTFFELSSSLSEDKKLVKWFIA